MTEYTLQDVLGFIDDNERFARWVAEMEQPGPSKHQEQSHTTSTKVHERWYVDCAKCGKLLFNNTWNYDGELPEFAPHLRYCEIPDPLTKSLPEIVEEKLTHVSYVELVHAIWFVKPAAGKDSDDTDAALVLAYEWFIKAGAKMQYLVLAVAEGKVK